MTYYPIWKKSVKKLAYHIDYQVQNLMDYNIRVFYINVCDRLIGFRVVIKVIKLGCYSSDGGYIPGETPGLMSSSLAG